MKRGSTKVHVHRRQVVQHVGFCPALELMDPNMEAGTKVSLDYLLIFFLTVSVEQDNKKN
jgi:hypothetical protein